jgi:hypothetical protein
MPHFRSRRAASRAALALAPLALLAPRPAAAQRTGSTLAAAGAALVRGNDANAFGSGWMLDLGVEGTRPGATPRLGQVSSRIGLTYARFGAQLAPRAALPPGQAPPRQPLGFVALTIGAVVAGPTLGPVGTYALGGGGLYGQSGPGVATPTLGLHTGAGASWRVALGQRATTLFAEWRANNLAPIGLARRPIAPPRFQPIAVGVRW